MTEHSHKNTKTPKLRFPGFSQPWVEKKLGNVAEFSKGKNISKSDITEEGLECIRYGELYTKYKEKIDQIYSRTNINKDELVLSKKNDVIIPASGETAIDISTASCIMHDGIAIGGDINILRTKEDGLFLAYFLKNKKQTEIANLAQGISVIHLYARQLSGLQIYLPTLPEQQKIANFLSDIDTKIEKLSRKKELMSEYKKGVMQKIFSQKIRFKDENGNDYPDWEEKRLGEVCEVKRGAGSNYIKYVNSETKGIRLIRIGDFLGSEPVYVENTDEIRRFTIKYGDILIAGTGATAGITFKVPKEFDNLAYSYNAPRIRSEKCDTEFLINYLESDTILNQQKRLFTGNAQPFLDIKAISNFKINLPCLEEQKKIAEFLTNLDKNIGNIDTELNAVKEFKKGLLQKLFV